MLIDLFPVESRSEYSKNVLFLATPQLYLDIFGILVILEQYSMTLQ